MMDPVWQDNFRRGMDDCAKGVKCRDWQGDGYYAGYAHQYEVEQALTAMGLIGEKTTGEDHERTI